MGDLVVFDEFGGCAADAVSYEAEIFCALF